MDNITIKQWQKIKSSIIDTNNCLNGTFNSLNHEFSSGFRLIDNFPSCFSFYQANHRDNKYREAYLCKLDEIFQITLMDSNSIVVISDTNIKNNVAISILHIHSSYNSIKKIIHHAINITSTETKLFAIKYKINQTVQIPEASHIVVITDTIHLVRCIFDSTTHCYQIQLIVIALDLKIFFNKHTQNLINFWNCPSNVKWSHYMSVNKDIKKFNLTPILPCKELWDFSKKEEYDNIIRNWQMTFQTSDFKVNHFLKLLDNDDHTIAPTYTKEGSLD